ncbi:Mucin-19 [Kitasatospora sp. CMC57]|uniref:Mucin-19 n=1 Tax=Kitasatospora sp. CMC57 TaxID=3231513 RepID=A0AB33JLJ2_9ACTN
MDRQTYNAELAGLRELRTEIGQAEKTVAAAQKELDKLAAQRSRRVAGLAGYEKADAATVAKASGLTLADVVRIAPLLDPTPAAVRTARAEDQAAAVVPAAAPVQAPVAEPAQHPEPAGALTPALTRPAPAVEQPAPAGVTAAVPSEVEDLAVVVVEVPSEVPAASVASVAAPARLAVESGPRELPTLPEGPDGARFEAVTTGLVSKRPNFTQQARATVFLDAATGDLAVRDQVVRLTLGAKSPGEILDAVLATAPGTERIYVTAGAPWHVGAERYSTLKDAVAGWLNTPSERWTTAVGAGRDKLAGHFVHQRQPVGRYAPATAPDTAMVEIRSMGEWFDADGADVATCRLAFTLLWQALRRHWDDAVLMGSPSQTGRDLWTRTIPTKGKWAGGYPVLSEELRGLLHATGGQGRTELILPPRVPEQLPALVEYDRTFAYAKHLWKSPVGTPTRITAASFAAMTEAEQAKALMSCSHWNIRVTVPQGWNHVGLLPAPVTGDRAWVYPSEPGTTFTTWAGGAEVHLALSNHIAPWKVEILGGLVFEDGKPLDDWGKRLKAAWADLTNLSKLHGDERQMQAAYLASRAVRSVLLFGLGGFAQRPRLVSGTTPAGEALPAGVEILGQDGEVVTWQRQAGFSRDPYAHPEWAAYVWSGARAALLDMKYRDGKEVVGVAGALHAKPGTVVYFGTDGIALTERQPWPYRGEVGDYLLKGHLTGPVPHPTSQEQYLQLRAQGRAALAAANVQTIGGDR